jgi:hypothetical protein
MTRQTYLDYIENNSSNPEYATGNLMTPEEMPFPKYF